MMNCCFAGNFSFRAPLFDKLMQALDEEDLTKTDIETLFTRVSGRIAENFSSHNPKKRFVRDFHHKKTIPVCYSMLVQDFYLA